ncbi:MAG: Lrp/AsnC family transcriptional regulator [Clostridiales bacterium]|nr:Lrp/AsnC family transcriptional regulator [Clostridiales bacterium]
MSTMQNLSEDDKKIVEWLQGDIPVVSDPFHALADELGFSVCRLLKRIEDFQEDGILKRVGAVVRHQKIGFDANAMVVWQVPVSDIESVGALFAEQTFVSHCYQRETLPDFPYTLYTMVHAKSESECLSYIKTLAELAGTINYKILPSLKEFKKSSMKYYYKRRKDESNEHY